MKNNRNTTLVLMLIGIILGLLCFIFLSGKNKEVNDDGIVPNEFSINGDGQAEDNTTPTQNQKMTKIKVPLISESSGDFGPFGCGAYINFVEKEVPETKAVLNATYEWLFNNPSTVGVYHNTIATHPNLNFQRVEIEYGMAKVYLTGVVMPNECGDANFGAQIEQAAFQYSSVFGIEVYVNGEIFDWCDLSQADASESHCDTTPKLWNIQKFKER